jgi:hypothetical protein
VRGELHTALAGLGVHLLVQFGATAVAAFAKRYVEMLLGGWAIARCFAPANCSGVREAGSAEPANDEIAVFAGCHCVVDPAFRGQ